MKPICTVASRIAGRMRGCLDEEILPGGNLNRGVAETETLPSFKEAIIIEQSDAPLAERYLWRELQKPVAAYWIAMELRQLRQKNRDNGIKMSADQDRILFRSVCHQAFELVEIPPRTWKKDLYRFVASALNPSAARKAGEASKERARQRGLPPQTIIIIRPTVKRFFSPIKIALMRKEAIINADERKDDEIEDL